MVGVDLGGTKILAAVVGPNHRILGRAKRPTPAEAGGPAILAAIVGTIDQALAEAGAARESILAIGIGSPGPLDPLTGIIPFSSNLNVRNWALGPDLSAAMGRPVLLQNDVRAGGYGEYRLGAGRGFRNVLAAFVGTGVGGCLILDGHVLEGATGNAGEIGHIIDQARRPAVRLRAAGLPRSPQQPDGDRPAGRQGRAEGAFLSARARRSTRSRASSRAATSPPRCSPTTRSPCRRSSVRPSSSGSGSAA